MRYSSNILLVEPHFGSRPCQRCPWTDIDLSKLLEKRKSSSYCHYTTIEMTGILQRKSNTVLESKCIEVPIVDCQLAAPHSKVRIIAKVCQPRYVVIIHEQNVGETFHNLSNLLHSPGDTQGHRSYNTKSTVYQQPAVLCML